MHEHLQHFLLRYLLTVNSGLTEVRSHTAFSCSGRRGTPLDVVVTLFQDVEHL